MMTRSRDCGRTSALLGHTPAKRGYFSGLRRGCWVTSVKVERIADAVPGLAYPVLIDATGRCPPEDVGGPWGYAEFLDAIADPAHENHAEMKDWAGEDFDPKAVNVEALADDVAALARKWARKPPAKRKQPT